jgi:hypothetical protein
VVELGAVVVATDAKDSRIGSAMASWTTANSLGAITIVFGCVKTPLIVARDAVITTAIVWVTHWTKFAITRLKVESVDMSKLVQ